MKIAVFSDSHGYGINMLNAIETHQPQMIIHLGDSGGELPEIKKKFPHIPLKAVRGNCDIASNLPEKEMFTINGVQLFITHGHRYGVKNGLNGLLNTAYCAGASLVMYGHTHRAYSGSMDTITVLNPGSCGLRSSEFALVIIDKDGNISIRHLKS